MQSETLINLMSTFQDLALCKQWCSRKNS